MKRRMRLLLVLFALSLLSCGPKKGAGNPAVRDFPAAEIPVMLDTPDERAEWLACHFWDRFTDTDRHHPCDSATVNGVPKEKLEEQVGLFATLLQQLPLSVGEKAMTACFGRLEAFQKAFPDGHVFAETSALITRYFYDPNSPVRSEDLYLPFVTGLAQSDLTPESLRLAYRWDARNCALNRTGTPAADFNFIDTDGRLRTLYGISAEFTLLIFGNPDCSACRDLMEQMDASEEIAELIGAGRLKVADIYIDEDIDLWMEKRSDYPADWINGYDPSFRIRTDLLYNVRALPSLYLLDKDKRVLLKDAPPERVLSMLVNAF